MSQPKRRTRNSSHTVAIAAVALLIVVAIAGIVLATRKPESPAGAVTLAVTPADPTPKGASAPTAQINPNEIVFAGGSSALPASAGAALARFAEAARSNGGAVRLTARFLTGENKARDLALARARTEAIRKVLQTRGVGPEKVQGELIEMPAGGVTEADANRIDLSLH